MRPIRNIDQPESYRMRLLGLVASGSSEAGPARMHLMHESHSLATSGEPYRRNTVSKDRHRWTLHVRSLCSETSEDACYDDSRVTLMIWTGSHYEDVQPWALAKANLYREVVHATLDASSYLARVASNSSLSRSLLLVFCILSPTKI